MHVWMTHCQRTCKCAHCPEQIEAGEPMVTGKVKLKGQEWYKTLHWHPQCWIEQGMVYLESRPYVPSHRGRVPLKLDEETKSKRFAILRRYASVMQRINKLVVKINESSEIDSESVSKLAHLSEMVEGLKVEIEPLGGVPKSWQ